MSWVALSPSLLPRNWWATGITVGLSAIVGYAVGTLVQAGWVALSRASKLTVSISPGWKRWLRRGWFGALVVLTAVSWWANVQRQQGLATSVGVSSAGWRGQSLGLLLGIVIFALLLGAGRTTLWIAHLIGHRLRLVLPGWLALITTVSTVTLIVVLLARGAVILPLLDEITKAAAASNGVTGSGRQPPVEPERSGSAASNESWESLGRQGRAVVADGPRAADIARVTGEPAMEPIRAYAGLSAGRDIEATAQAVVAELDRTNAWQRSYLMVATAVSNGWTEEYTLASVEYLTRGDVASASMQYSFLPSGVAYVIDRSSAAEAGRDLWQAIYQRWLQLPADHRPKLLVSGESMGAFGSQAAFDSPGELLDEAYGAVWAGTPRFTPLWAQLTAARRIGSPEVAPVIDNGRNIRFATNVAELEHDHFGGLYEPWQQHPRVVYLQNASDPVVWWSADLLWREPDWMREQTSNQSGATMTWMPWVTFWQITLDMPDALTPQAGQGHQYQSELIPVWNAVLGQPASDAELAAIAQAINASLVPR